MLRHIPSLLIAVLTVCILPTHAQDPLTAFPDNYKLVLDNAQVRVLRCHYGPHEHVGVHNHSDYPTVYVYLSDSGPVRFSHIEEHAFVMTRPPVKKGAFRVSPGRPERHIVENLSDLSSDYLRIELKQIPLHGTLHPVRGEAPANLDKNTVEAVFHDPQLTIQRIVCTPGNMCEAGIPSSPSLLVAFTAVTFSGSMPKQMQPGEILWTPDGALKLHATSAEPAHLLRLELRPSK